MHRRRFLGSISALAGAVALRARDAYAQAKPLAFADMHSHIGILSAPADVHATMVANGVLVIARKIVADLPVIRRIPNQGVQQVREPAPGELASRFDATFARLQAEHKAQNLIEIVDAEALARVMSGQNPAVVLAAEGADFLEGDLKRLEAARRNGLVHLQLVHYRVSELGDISTERPVHNGFTPFGKDVIAACNRLGILVDIAHATSDGIAQALEISAKPMIYSHGHMTGTNPYWTQGGLRARAIHTPLAKRVAEKGGVIGLWPLTLQYRSLEVYAGALLDLAAAVGAAHVGVGSDMFGLPASVIPAYQQFGELEQLLARRGARPEDVRNILGANYLRVLKNALTV
ncbi:MAG TPA: membrane dipeptidase [Burkholderiales bacterium]|nr:membrane dipeptidase [Burkholderiales bacterium]